MGINVRRNRFRVLSRRRGERAGAGMKRKTLVTMVASAIVVLGYSAYGMTRAFYPIPMGNLAYRVIHPARRLVSGQAAINVARRYAGPQGSFPKRPFDVFGVVETPKYHGPAWLVVDRYAFIPSTGPNPRRVGRKGGFLTVQTLDIVVNARTGQPVEAFTPPGPFHGGF